MSDVPSDDLVVARLDAGRLLRAARRSRRLSQRELAALAGLPSSTLARAEAGVTDPKFSTVVDLLSAVGYEFLVGDRRSRLLVFDHEHERLIDRGGRHFPAHLRSGKTGPFESQWWGWHRIAWSIYDDTVPTHTYQQRYFPPLLGEQTTCHKVWDDAT